MASINMTGNGTTSPRRQRYNRSSTASMTQLLSDSYSSFINRLTRRGPSEKTETAADAKLSAVRSRYDDKFLSNKSSALSNVRRYENNGHISPYTSLSSGVSAPAATRKLAEERAYGYLAGAPKPRVDASPLHSVSGISALTRTDSFRRAHVKDNKSSPFTKRYPLKEANNNIEGAIYLGSTRSRLEDKYSSVLDRIAIQKKERARKEREDRDKTLEPEPTLPRGGLMRSLTTAVFGENSFRRNNYSREKTRDKTPFRNTADRRLSSHKQKDKDDYKNGFDVALRDVKTYYGKDRDSIYRRHLRRSLRAEKSENERKLAKLSIRPIDITSTQQGSRDLISPLHSAKEISSKFTTKTPASSPTREKGGQKQIYFPSSDEDEDKTPVGDRMLSDRETKRQEIQGLIMKYAHLDEMYGRMAGKETKEAASEGIVARKPEPLAVGDLVVLPPELRSRTRAQRPRHLTRRAATPPVSTMLTACACASVCR